MDILITQEVKATISREQVKAITVKYLEDTYNIKSHYYLKDGNLMEEVESCYTSRCVTTQEIIREATKADIALIALVREIKKSK